MRRTATSPWTSTPRARSSAPTTGSLVRPRTCSTARSSSSSSPASAAPWSRSSRRSGVDALFALQRVLDGEELDPRRAVLRALSVRRPRRRRRPDRREGRPVAGPARAGRSRPLRPRGRGASRRHRRARRQVPHVGVARTPTRSSCCPPARWAEDDADYAVAFAVPANTPGLSMYVSSYGAGDRDPFEFPLSSKHKMLETLTVFDDVFVPWDRVFLCRRAGARRPARPDVRRVPPVHRRVLQAAAARRARRHRGARRRDERRAAGRAHPREAHAADHLRRDGARA